MPRPVALVRATLAAATLAVAVAAAAVAATLAVAVAAATLAVAAAAPEPAAVAAIPQHQVSTEFLLSCETELFLCVCKVSFAALSALCAASGNQGLHIAAVTLFLYLSLSQAF